MRMMILLLLLIRSIMNIQELASEFSRQICSRKYTDPLQAQAQPLVTLPLILATLQPFGNGFAQWKEICSIGRIQDRCQLWQLVLPGVTRLFCLSFNLDFLLGLRPNVASLCIFYHILRNLDSSRFNIGPGQDVDGRLLCHVLRVPSSLSMSMSTSSLISVVCSFTHQLLVICILY